MGTAFLSTCINNEFTAARPASTSLFNDPGVSTPGDPSLSDLSEVGYKCFMWHLKADGSMPMFNGAYGQRVSTRVACFVDLRAVLLDRDCWLWVSEGV